MILVDTSIWIDHFRSGNATLATLLETSQVLSHPFVIGELALGNLRQRNVIMASLQDLPHATVATDQEVLEFIERHKLMALGIGYIDVHLLASARLTPGASFWSRDKHLLAAADKLGLLADAAR